MKNQLKELYSVIASIGFSFRFFGRMMGAIVYVRLWLPQLMIQVYSMGMGTLVLIIWASIFIGLVFSLQMYDILEKFSGLSQLSSVVCYGVFRELGPVVTGLLLAGRVGSSVAAEIAIMRQNEQINALWMMGVSPYGYLMLPRFLSGLIVAPILVAIFDAFALLASWGLACGINGMEGQIFWNPLQEEVLFYHDVVLGVFKGLFFGAVTLIVALFCGFNTKRGSSGVASASTTSVVVSSLFILGADYLLTSFLY